MRDALAWLMSDRVPKLIAMVIILWVARSVPRRSEALPPSGLRNKPFAPTHPELFPRTAYGGPAAQPREFPLAPGKVRIELKRWLDLQERAGLISAKQAEEALAAFQDPEIRSNFTDESSFRARLLAGALLLNGTSARAALPALLTGENASGAPAKLVFTNLGLTAVAKTAVVSTPEGRERWLLCLNSSPENRRMEGEPLPVITATLAHEALHQDNSQSQHEEAAAKWVESVVWGEFLLIAPKLASSNTPVARMSNLELLMWLNSGSAFPYPGLLAAPVPDPQAAPGATDLPYESYWEFIRKKLYPTAPGHETPGNNYLTSITHAPGAFNRTLLRQLDACPAIAPEDCRKLISILGLVPTPGSRPTKP